jgi:hypothetical protein
MNKKDVETVEPESAESGFVSELKWIGDCQLSQEAEFAGLYIYIFSSLFRKKAFEKERQRRERRAEKITSRNLNENVVTRKENNE